MRSQPPTARGLAVQGRDASAYASALSPTVATPSRPYLIQVFAVSGWRLGTQKGSYVVTLSRPCLAKIFPPPFVLVYSTAPVRGKDEIPYPPLVNHRCCGTLTIGLIL